MSKSLLFLFTIFLIASCSPDGGEGSGLVSMIINGKVATTESSIARSNAVALIENIGGKLTPFCTGSIIGKRYLLTASHCFLKKSYTNIQVAFTQADEAKRYIDIEQVVHAQNELTDRYNVHFHPRDDLGFNFDLALVTLKEDIPSNYTPVEILPIELEEKLLQKNTLVLAGFGRTENSGTAAVDQLRETTVDIRAIHRSNLEKSVITYKNRDRITGACNGDSGGPAYAQIDGAWYLVGSTVGEYGMLFDGKKHSCYSSQGVYTYLNSYIGWIGKHTSRDMEGMGDFDPFAFATDNSSESDAFTCQHSKDLTLERWLSLFRYVKDVIETSKCDKVRDHFAQTKVLRERPDTEKSLIIDGWGPFGNYYFTKYFSNLKEVSLVLGRKLRASTKRELNADSDYYYLKTTLYDIEYLPSSVEKLILRGGTLKYNFTLLDLKERMEVDAQFVEFETTIPIRWYRGVWR